MNESQPLVSEFDRVVDIAGGHGRVETGDADVLRVVLVGFRGVLGAGLCQVIERDAGFRAVVSDGAEDLSMVVAHHGPDVLLVWCDALASVIELRRLVLAHPETGVVVAVPHVKRERDDALLCAGARVVLPISAESDELRAALRLVGRGLVGPPGAALKPSTAGVGLLTAREAEVLELLAARRSALEIAETLHVSVATVNSHRRHIYEKLGVHSRRELALSAALWEAHNQIAPVAQVRASLAYRRRSEPRPRASAVMIAVCRPLRAPRWLDRSA